MVKQDSNKANKGKLEKTSHLEKEYMVQERLASDLRFGESTLVVNKTDKTQRLLLKEYLTNSETEAQKKVNTLEQRLKLNHNHIQEMRDWTAGKKSDFCSTYYKLKGFYQYPDGDLRQMIDRARREKTEISHATLTHILYQMLDATCYLHQHGCAFEDVRPMYIGRVCDETFVLLDRLRDPSHAYDCQRYYFNLGQALYASPKVYKAVVKKDKAFTHSKEKSDTWSLGLSVLEAGVLESVRDIYNKNGTVDEAKLSSHLHNFKHRYGANNTLLCDMVEHCLIVDEDKRKDCCELLATVPAYCNVKDFLNNPNTEICEPHHEVVVEHRPVVHHQEHVVSHHEPTIHRSEVIRREPRVIRETAPVETRHEVERREPEVRREVRRVEAPVTHHQEVVRHEPVHHHQEVKRVSHHGEVRRVEAPVTHHHHQEVKRVSHHGEVVRREPEVRRVEGSHHHGEVRRVEGSRVVQGSHREGNVVRQSHHAHESRVVNSNRQEGTVVRRSVHAEGEGYVRRVEGSHQHGEVRRVEGGVRRVEGSHHHGEVVRSSHHGDSRAHEGYVRKEGNHHGEVRRVEGGNNHTQQAHTSNVRVIRDQDEVRKYLDNNSERVVEHEMVQEGHMEQNEGQGHQESDYHHDDGQVVHEEVVHHQN